MKPADRSPASRNDAPASGAFVVPSPRPGEKPPPTVEMSALPASPDVDDDVPVAEALRAPERSKSDRDRGAILRVRSPGGAETRLEVHSTLTIGRDEGLDLVLHDDPFVSPRHACLRLEDGLLSIEDLASLNGIFVPVRQPVDLEDGDRFLIGGHVFRFELVLRSEEEKLEITMSMDDPTTMVLGTPGEEVLARLVVRLSSGARGKEYYLGRQTVVLGSGKGTHNFLSDAGIAPRHAVIERGPDGGFLLRDLHTRTGTWRQVRGAEYLPDDARFRIGRHLFEVVR